MILLKVILDSQDTLVLRVPMMGFLVFLLGGGLPMYMARRTI